MIFYRLCRNANGCTMSRKRFCDNGPSADYSIISYFKLINNLCTSTDIYAFSNNHFTRDIDRRHKSGIVFYHRIMPHGTLQVQDYVIFYLHIGRYHHASTYNASLANLNIIFVSNPCRRVNHRRISNQRISYSIKYFFFDNWTTNRNYKVYRCFPFIQILRFTQRGITVHHHTLLIPVIKETDNIPRRLNFVDILNQRQYFAAKSANAKYRDISHAAFLLYAASRAPVSTPPRFILFARLSA